MFENVKIFYLDSVPGLFIHKLPGYKGWKITHKNSVLWVASDIKSKSLAEDAMIRFGKLANWEELSQGDVTSNKDLCEKAKEVVDYIRRNNEN